MDSIIWVVSENTNERALIVAQLEEEGFEARGFESLADLFAALAVETPRLLVIDTMDLGLDTGKWEAVRMLTRSVRTILITPAGTSALPADLVLPRPFSIGELVGKIDLIIFGGSDGAGLRFAAGA